MLRADRVVASGDWSGDPADAVVLEFDERYRRRAVMTGVGGLAFQLDLPEAAMLRGGDGLRLEDGRIVEIVAAPEALFEIRAADPLALLQIALRLGNLHAPTEATAKALRVRRDPEVEAMAKGLGARVIPLEAPFNPEGAAYVLAEAREHDHAHAHHHDHGHDHDHAHGHDHEYEHDHEHEYDHPRHARGHDHDQEHAHGERPHRHDRDHAEHQHHGDDQAEHDNKH